MSLQIGRNLKRGGVPLFVFGSAADAVPKIARRPSIYYDVPTILTIASGVDYLTAATVDIGRNNDDLRACRR